MFWRCFCSILPLFKQVQWLLLSHFNILFRPHTLCTTHSSFMQCIRFYRDTYINGAFQRHERFDPIQRETFRRFSQRQKERERKVHTIIQLIQLEVGASAKRTNRIIQKQKCCYQNSMFYIIRILFLFLFLLLLLEHDRIQHTCMHTFTNILSDVYMYSINQIQMEYSDFFHPCLQQDHFSLYINSIKYSLVSRSLVVPYADANRYHSLISVKSCGKFVRTRNRIALTLCTIERSWPECFRLLFN